MSSVLGRTSKLPESPCPTCGTPLGATTGIGHQETVTPGDTSICMECGEFLVFGEGLRLRKMELSEELALPDEISCRMRFIRDSVRAFRSLKGLSRPERDRS